MSAVVAQRIDIPPGIAARTDWPIEARSASRQADRHAGPKAPPSARPVPDACCPPPNRGPAFPFALPAAGTRPSIRASPAIQRPARRGKQLVEIRPASSPPLLPVSGGCAGRIVPAARNVRSAHCSISVGVKWRGRQFAGALTRQKVAPVRLTGADGSAVAILRADIDRGLRWQPAAAEDVVELGAGSRREKNTLWRGSGKPVRRARQRPGQRRQATGRMRHGSGSAWAAGSPSKPSATAATSAFTITASAWQCVPRSASLTPHDPPGVDEDRASSVA